jgi:hypothetical protein
VAEDFIYSSDRNDQWLGVDQLRAMIADMIAADPAHG